MCNFLHDGMVPIVVGKMPAPLAYCGFICVYSSILALAWFKGLWNPWFGSTEWALPYIYHMEKKQVIVMDVYNWRFGLYIIIYHTRMLDTSQRPDSSSIN